MYITSNLVELSKTKFRTYRIKDQYGNYVIQKAMSISDEETLNKIIEQIKPIILKLLLNSHGKKIIICIFLLLFNESVFSIYKYFCLLLKICKNLIFINLGLFCNFWIIYYLNKSNIFIVLLYLSCMGIEK